ncbi:HAD family hydrolase [Streptomyces echinatus]|uniref:HAD family hydrolase n=1 Tax=Streptomyces echinatus TaxID=67293 RepID=UPI00378B55CC
MLALFDLDNTLIDRRGGLKDWARGFVRSRRLSQGAVSTICDRLRERAYPADFVDLRVLLGLSDTPGDLWHEYVDGIARSVRCAPEVRKGLEELRVAGWTLGVATNGAGDVQRAQTCRDRAHVALRRRLCVGGNRRPETGVRAL